MRFESFRKAFAQGKKKTAENVHRARNRVSRLEIAESLEDMEARYKQWKKTSRKGKISTHMTSERQV